MTEEEEDNYEEDFEDDHMVIRLPEGESGAASDCERECECMTEWAAEEKQKKKKRNKKAKK